MKQKTTATLSLIMICAAMCGSTCPTRQDNRTVVAAAKTFTPYSAGSRQWEAACPAARQSISDYDTIIRPLARSAGCDWRLISAIAFTESRFDHSVVSSSGARGLMQIMPSVARQFGVPESEIADPGTNIRLGIQLLGHIDRNLHLRPGAGADDRLRITLAAYNCGVGHVQDARRLARNDGMNPDSWPVVARYLELKFNPEYYMDQAVRCGQFEDSKQTLSFVDRVVRSYDEYCRRQPML